MSVAASSSVALPSIAWGGLQATPPAVVPAASMWRQTLLVAHPDGREESFAIGPDGFVWSYEIGSAGQGHGRLFSTGLRGSVFAVGRAGEGALVVVAAGEEGVHCVREAGSGASRWSEPAPVQVPWLGPQGMIERIVTTTQYGNLFVAFLVRQPDGQGGTRLRMMDAVYTGGTLVVRHEPVGKRGLSFWIDRLGNTLN